MVARPPGEEDDALLFGLGDVELWSPLLDVELLRCVGFPSGAVAQAYLVSYFHRRALGRLEPEEWAAAGAVEALARFTGWTPRWCRNVLRELKRRGLVRLRGDVEGAGRGNRLSVELSYGLEKRIRMHGKRIPNAGNRIQGSEKRILGSDPSCYGDSGRDGDSPLPPQEGGTGPEPRAEARGEGAGDPVPGTGAPLPAAPEGEEGRSATPGPIPGPGTLLETLRARRPKR